MNYRLCATPRLVLAAHLALLALALTACSDEPSQADRPLTGAGTGAPPATNGEASGAAAMAGTGGIPASPMGPGGAGAAGMMQSLPPPAGGGAGGGGMDAAGAGAAGEAGASGAAAAGNAAPRPDGPVDGDPSKPMVEIPGVPCGVPRAGFGQSPPTVQITGRDVVVAYPCAHEGAAVTFFLFLHGTLQEAQKVAFTMNAFPVHTLVDSHNMIVVVPKAIGTQWGNGDGGQDQPHLYEVVDWVYETFGEKFDIRSMWASGGSWGAFYLSSTFACDPAFEDRLKGVRMVVGGGCPRCSDRLACIVAQQELELGGGMPLSDAEKEMRVQRANIEPYATAHGCDARTGPVDLGPVRHWEWPNCDSGFAHSYYLGPGQHADPWNDPVSLLKMTEEMKSIED